MWRTCVTRVVLAWLAMSLVLILGVQGTARAEAWKWHPNGTEKGQWLFGFRAGFAPLTQSLASNTSTDVGSLVNLEGLYSLNKWLLIGFMLEWERHAVDLEVPNVALGHQDTVSLLPTVEVRPGRVGPIVPYGSMGFGVNVNSFDDDISGVSTSPSNNFAWRLAWGADYFVTSKLALNAEMAYKRNDGYATVNGARVNDWDASSFGFLFGLHATF